MKVVVVTGSRNGWPRPEEVRAVVRGADVLIVGDASGVDSIARREAVAFGITVEMFVADWDNIGSGAGPLRNQKMVERAHRLRATGADVNCSAFPGAASRGTHDCVRRLRLAGFRVEVHKQ